MSAFRSRARVPVEKHGYCVNGAGRHSKAEHEKCPVEFTTSMGKHRGVVFHCQCKEHGGHGDVPEWPIKDVDVPADEDE